MEPTPKRNKPISEREIDRFLEEKKAEREQELLMMRYAGKLTGPHNSPVHRTLAEAREQLETHLRDVRERQRKDRERWQAIRARQAALRSYHAWLDWEARRKRAEREAEELERLRQAVAKRVAPRVEQRLEFEKDRVRRENPLPEVSKSKLKSANKSSKKADKTVTAYKTASKRQQELLDAVETTRQSLSEAEILPILNFALSAPPFLSADLLLLLWDMAGGDMALASELALMLRFQDDLQSLFLAKSVCGFGGSRLRLAQRCVRILERGVTLDLVLPLAEFWLECTYGPLNLLLLEKAATAKSPERKLWCLNVIDLSRKNVKHAATLVSLLQAPLSLETLLVLGEDNLLPCARAMQWLAINALSPLFPKCLKSMRRYVVQANSVPDLLALCTTPQLTADQALDFLVAFTPEHVIEVIQTLANPGPVTQQGVGECLSVTNSGTVAAQWTLRLEHLVRENELAQDIALLRNAVNAATTNPEVRRLLNQVLDQLRLGGGYDLQVADSFDDKYIREAGEIWELKLFNTPNLNLIYNNPNMPGRKEEIKWKNRPPYSELTRNFIVSVRYKLRGRLKMVEHNIHAHPPGQWRMKK